MLANNVNSQKDKRMINIIFALSAAVILFSTLSNNLPTGIIGAIGVMVVVGYILNLIGDKTPNRQLRRKMNHRYQSMSWV